MKNRNLLILAACAALSLSPAAFAQTVAPAAPAAAPATGVKTHRVVFAVTSGDEADWNSALGNIRNLMTAFKPDPVEIEVVSYSGGINMIVLASTVASQIAALQAQGVHFMACQNSMRMHKLEVKDLLPGMEPVPSGVTEVVKKQEQGWAYIKAGK